MVEVTEFDIGRFKAGEPAFGMGKEWHYLADRTQYSTFPFVIENEDGGIDAISSKGVLSGGAVLTMKSDSKLKLVNLSKLPVNTMLKTVHSSQVYCFSNMVGSDTVMVFADGGTSYTSEEGIALQRKDISIADNQPWTIWQGCICPVPDGLEFEYMEHDQPNYPQIPDQDDVVDWCSEGVYAYRLTGRTLEGWKI